MSQPDSLLHSFVAIHTPYHLDDRTCEQHTPAFRGRSAASQWGVVNLVAETMLGGMWSFCTFAPDGVGGVAIRSAPLHM